MSGDEPVLKKGIKNTPLVQVPLKWYNLEWSGLYLSVYLIRVIYVKAVPVGAGIAFVFIVNFCFLVVELL